MIRSIIAYLLPILMTQYLIIILVFLPCFLSAQSDTLTNRKDFQLTLPNLKIDSSFKEIKPLSILHLKSYLDSQRDKLSLINPDNNNEENEQALYDFTEEELSSGLSINELNAYRKNKDLLNKILKDKYDECWWYRVQSLGQLIGISDWFIKALMFSLLLL